MTAATERDPAPGATEPLESPTEAAEAEEATSPDGPVEEATEEDSPAPAGESSDAPACGQCTDYLDSLTRLKAEFANFRRRSAEQQAQAAERGAADLATRLLAVLDASEAGAAHDSELVGPLHGALLDALTEGGLEVISPAGQPFDPNYHEAALHTTAESPGDPIVTEVLRTGYAWNGRVLRPAVVGVLG
ncbi:MAG: nucleotide exchange factor GrpE [Acidimicrobiia bacterium]|nr:nucleotide exchange factor GrpE [Acidimicrobiia bacterium]